MQHVFLQQGLTHLAGTHRLLGHDADVAAPPPPPLQQQQQQQRVARSSSRSRKERREAIEATMSAVTHMLGGQAEQDLGNPDARQRVFRYLRSADLSAADFAAVPPFVDCAKHASLALGPLVAGLAFAVRYTLEPPLVQRLRFSDADLTAVLPLINPTKHASLAPRR